MAEPTDPVPGPGSAAGVDIYAVGALADLRDAVHAPRAARREARRRLLRSLTTSWRHRSYWNGYLAEPLLDDGSWTRCGHGWTRGRAWDDLQLHRATLAEQRAGAA
jgi:hypothetical protein